MITLALVATAPHAQAQPAIEAETLFRDGVRLMKARQYAQACAAFAASDRLDPTIAAKLRRADCEEQRGRLATAWSAFLQVATLTRDDLAHQAEHAVATARGLALEPRLPHLTITVAPEARVPGLAITRNGAAVDPSVWNRAVPVDRMAHAVEATAPGHRPWSTTVVIEGEAEAQTIVVPRFEAAGGGAARRVGPAEVAPGAPPRPAPRSWRWPGVLGGTAVALGGVAVGLELSARGRYADAVAASDGALYDDAVRRRRGAVASGIGAGVLALGATYLVWRGRGHSRSVTVAVRAGDGGLGLAIGGGL
ncbi:MAG: hypothetical protein R3B06_03390 [Kofleriaceae bacterium]